MAQEWFCCVDEALLLLLSPRVTCARLALRVLPFILVLTYSSAGGLRVPVCFCKRVWTLFGFQKYLDSPKVLELNLSPTLFGFRD